MTLQTIDSIDGVSFRDDAVELNLAAKTDDGKRRFRMKAHTGQMLDMGWAGKWIFDLGGMNTGHGKTAILFEHDTQKPIGYTDSKRKTESGLELDGEMLSNAESQKVVSDADEGFPWQASIGVDIRDREFVEQGKKRVVNGASHDGPFWIVRKSRLRESSVCALGRDGNTSTVFMSRGKVLSGVDVDGASPSDEQLSRGDIMSDSEVNEATPKKPDTSPEVQPDKTGLSEQEVKAKVDAAVKEAVELERQKSAFVALADKLGHGEWARAQVKNNCTIAELESALLEKLAEKLTPVSTPTVEVGEDLNIKTLDSAVTDAILLRSGVKLEKSEPRASEFRGFSFVEMGRLRFEALGWREARTMPRSELTRYLFDSRKFYRDAPEHVRLASTSDFDYILENAMNKSLTRAYEDAPSTWQLWCRRTTAPDFRYINRANMSEFPSLTAIDEGKGVQYTDLSDGRERYVLREYNGGIKLTRRAIINDDLDAFGRIPGLEGMAARRLENVTAYGILTANAAMADTGNLFNSTAVTTTGGHANSSTGTLSVSSLQTHTTLMGRQKGPKNAANLGLSPRWLIVPKSLEATAKQLIGSRQDPAKSNETLNPYYNQLEVIVEPILDDTSTAYYYYAADYNRIDTVEVAFLEGEESPQLAQETVFDTGDVKFKVTHTVAAKAIEWRGLVFSTGA